MVDVAEGPETLRVAVLSDIHVHHDATDRSSAWHIAVGMDASNSKLNPFYGLSALAAKHPDVSADLLICCGDITDRAHPGALRYGWDQLEELRVALKARHTVATAGNHDVDSRYSHSDFDARGALVDLENPRFPVSDLELANEYWTRHFCILEEPTHRVVVLNSAAYHGAAPVGGEVVEGHVSEHLHGRVSAQTVARIAARLDGLTPRGLNLLVCHHHPARLDALSHGDPSEMDGGQALLDELAKPGRGRWLILHGHRHIAAVQRPGGSVINAASTVFCAGSFGKVLPSGWQSPNQFYILDLHLRPKTSVGLDVAGTFRSWSWTNGQGWQLAGFKDQLPGRGGFGFVGSLGELASKIKDELTASKAPSLRLEEAERAVPFLAFVPPGDWPHLIQELKGLSISILLDPDDGEVHFMRGAA